MENICIIDIKANFLEPSTDKENVKILEIASVLFNIPTRSILSEASVLCYTDSNIVRYESSDSYYHISKINTESFKKIDSDLQISCFKMIKEIIKHSDAIVAHNATLHKKLIQTLIDFQELSQQKKWICTRNDVVWPTIKDTPLDLINICYYLGVPIVKSRRALADCLLLIDALQCIKDIPQFLDKSNSIKIKYYAKISFDQRQIVKDAGFLWDNVNKVWHAKLTPEQASKLPFTVYPM